MRLIILSMISIVTLSGCAGVSPVSGRIADTDEIFIGTYPSNALTGASGEMKLTSNKGANCRATLEEVNTLSRQGVITCDDGRSGTFKFITDAYFVSTVGYGEIGGKAFSFSDN